MTIALFGEDIFTATVLQALISDKHTVAIIICPLYKNSVEYRTLKTSATRHAIPFLHKENINDGETREILLQAKPDLIISVHLRKILSKDIYSIATSGAINVHPSLLPKYKGLSPQHQVFIHGDAETGVTVHFIEETVDTGDIIIQEKIPLTADMYVFDLHLKMLDVYKHIVNKAIRLVMNESYTASRQDISNSSWFGSLKKSDREIDFKKTKFVVYNLIRAVSKPYKGAFYNDIIVWRALSPDITTEMIYLEKYPASGMYKVEDLLLIRLEDGVLLSDDFEEVNK